MSAGAPDATAAVNVCYNEPFVISIYLYQLQQGTNQNPIFFLFLAKWNTRATKASWNKKSTTFEKRPRRNRFFKH